MARAAAAVLVPSFWLDMPSNVVIKVARRPPNVIVAYIPAPCNPCTPRQLPDYGYMYIQYPSRLDFSFSHVHV